MFKEHYEDCAVGDVTLSPRRTITETDVVQFAGMTGDWMPMHTDDVYAKESEFGERIAHGMLVLAVGSALLLRGGGGSGGALPQRTLALYGIDKVRFLGPTRFGDTLQTEGELTRMNELDDQRGVITLDGTVRNQRAEDLVRFTMRAIVGRRPA